MKENKKIVDMEIKKLVNMSRLLTEDKINERIVYIIEKYEGYNEFAKTEIEALLSNLGYSVESPKCKTDYKEMYLVDNFEYNYKYCVYIEEENPAKDQYFTYGVLTYMQIDLPLINMLNIPIFTRTNQIYKFTSTKPL